MWQRPLQSQRLRGPHEDGPLQPAKYNAFPPITVPLSQTLIGSQTSASPSPAGTEGEMLTSEAGQRPCPSLLQRTSFVDQAGSGEEGAGLKTGSELLFSRTRPF